MFKLSRYNWSIEFNNSSYIYNGYTGAVLQLDDDNQSRLIVSIIDSDHTTVPEAVISSEVLFTLLYDNGFIIEADFDERSEMSFKFESQRFSSSSWPNATIVMTENCNFACEYCYESLTPESTTKTISQSVIDRIPIFASRLVEERNSPGFLLTLYGGEPLLEKDSCLALLKSVQSAMQAIDKKFKAGIISNGYYLDGVAARRFADHGLKSAQVTIDLNPSTHDSTRPLKSNNNGTFDRILNNVIEASEYIRIAVRMNVNESYSTDTDRLFQAISNNDNIVAYVHPVSLDHQDTPSEYYKNLLAITKTPKLRSISRGCIRQYFKVHACSAIDPYGFVIDTKGRILKCWHQVGLNDHDSYGDIFDQSEDIQYRKLSKWLDFSPYRKGSRCYSCKYLPNCGATCAWYALAEKHHCVYYDKPSFKLYLHDHIQALYSKSVTEK